MVQVVVMASVRLSKAVPKALSENASSLIPLLCTAGLGATMVEVIWRAPITAFQSREAACAALSKLTVPLELLPNLIWIGTVPAGHLTGRATPPLRVSLM